MNIAIETGSMTQFEEVQQWLASEELIWRDATYGMRGFHCNLRRIRDGFVDGRALVAVSDGLAVAFVIIRDADEDISEISFIETHPLLRGAGIARELAVAALGRLRALGVKAVDVECTSSASEKLFRSIGFEDNADERNRSDGVELRLYLTDWRPKPKHPFM